MSRGFTLIELLATIAIIGILASTIMAAITSSREKARDSRRIASLGEIQKGLILYYDANQTFPITTPPGYVGPDAAIQMLYAAGYIKSDPALDTNTYTYFGGVETTGPFTECTAGICLGYSLSVLMERADNPILSKDADAQISNAGVIFEGASTDCGNAVSAPDLCYDKTAL